MKHFSVQAVIAAVALLPALALAQSSAPVTREQVRTQLIQLEQAGFDPFVNCTGDCAGSLRRAENNLTRQQSVDDGGYGPVMDGTQQSAR